ncbi:MAG: hypothetical protein ABIJ92_02945 [Candidatus Aenigmatarchaeota archaeon]
MKILTINSLEGEGKSYMGRILATDGMNTGNDTSNTIFEIDNDLNITEFSDVYSNNTERVFRVFVNNTLDINITNISWSLDTGEDMKSSEYLGNLKPSEQVFIYVYNNYTLTGNYTVIMSVYTDEYLEKDEIEIIV